MPTYDYRCAKCGEDLEVYQTFSEAPLTRHKGCGGKLAKVLSPAGIVLKGSGFYKTDNRSSKSGANGNGNGKESSGKESSGSESKSSESKSSEPSSSSASKPDSGASSSGKKETASSSSSSGS